MPERQITTEYDWLVLEPLSMDDWLVVDRGQEAITGDGTIGHIQHFLGMYEALRRSDPLGRYFYGDLESAVDSFAPWDVTGRDTVDTVATVATVDTVDTENIIAA
ncbi:hypothetical protein BH09ACT1_BH09ACT1_24810 [soil metagenome]